MSEITKDVNNEEINEMEAALNYPNYQTGQLVKGTVVQVTNDDVMVDIKWKSEGFIPLNELAAYRVEDPHEIVKEGDEVEVIIVKVDDNEGRIMLSLRRAAAIKAWDILAEKFEKQETVSGTIKEVVKGGLLVDLGVRAFLPASLVDIGYTENLDTYLGKSIEAKIVDFDKDKGKVVLSRKVLLEADKAKAKEETWKDIEVGQVKKGVVRRLTSFGAFVDIGGVDGLLHVSEMAWHRVKDPSEIVKVNDEIEVQVIEVDKQKEKVSLSLKQVLRNPWEVVAEKYPVGSIVTGKVVRLAPFGAFVELEPGIDGLVHLSQLSEKRVAKADEVVSVGEEVKAKVIEIKEDQKRISLSLKDMSLDAEAQQVQNYLDKQPLEQGVVLGDVFGDLFDKKEDA